MISAASQILLTRQLAGLRRQQWTTLNSVGFITAALPQGELRALCERALQAMRVGAPTAQRGADPLEHALARGEDAGPETFECLAEALEAREQAASAQESATQLARLLIAGPLLLGTLLGWISPFDDLFRGQTVPAITQ